MQQAAITVVLRFLEQVRTSPGQYIGHSWQESPDAGHIFLEGLRSGLALVNRLPKEYRKLATTVRAEQGWPIGATLLWYVMHAAGWTPAAITDGLLAFEIEVWTRLAHQLQTEEAS